MSTVSPDAVAADQIRALASLAEALHRDVRRRVFISLSGSEPPRSRYPDPSIRLHPPLHAPKGNGIDIAEAEYWLDHCARLSGRMDDFDHQTRRGYTIACRLLGLSWSDVQHAIGSACTAGVGPAAKVWAPYLSAPDARFVGHVYVARHEYDRGERKVGFSTNLAKRMTSLSRVEGEPVVLVNALPGTMLIEWALHADLGHTVTDKAEWYPKTSIPTWLLAAEA